MRSMNVSRRMALVLAVVVLGATACGEDSTNDAAGDEVTATTVADAAAPAVIRLPATAGGATAADSVAESASPDGLTQRLAWQVYEFDGPLPETPTAAAAWTFPAGAEPGEAAVLALAQAFGLDGEIDTLPVEQGDGWVVGSADFTAASLRVSRTAMLDWYYSPGPSDLDPVAMSACEPVAEPAPDAPVDGSGTVGGCDTVTPEPPVGVPTAEEAEAAIVALMNAGGLDPAAYEIDATADEWGAYANAWLLLDGKRSPLSVSVGFGAEGAVTWASGYLATPQPAGEYPLVDAAAALTRLNDQSVQWYGGGGVIALDDSVSSGAATESAPAPAEIPPVDGGDVLVDPVPEPSGPVTVVLTGLRTDLTMVWDADDVVWLLPAYTFLGGDGSEFSVLAVTDEYLIQPEPMVLPEPGVTDTVVTDPGMTEPGDPGAVVELAQAEADGLIGLATEEAAKVAEAQGWGFRVAELEGEPQVMTMDYRTDRVNVVVVGGVVTAVTIG